MSPAPDLSEENIILNTLPNTTVRNVISSSDELDYNLLTEPRIDLGSLTMDSMDSVDLGGEDDGPPTLTTEPIPMYTTCSAPSTPTGERDPPVLFRRASFTATTSNEPAQIEIKYQSVSNNVVMNSSSTNSDNNNGFIDTFLGCLKPIFSAVNKIGENIKSSRDASNTSKADDEWVIPIDNIMNDLKFLGTGIEGRVYLGKLRGQNIACKQVKTEEETNIKHLRKLNHVNVIKFRGVSISPPLFYIVMEYCPYGSLYDVLKRRREKHSCTKPTQVLEWSKQISNGVNYLHANKIVHRDLKSPNILIAENQVLKISDFGTSKQLGNKQGQVMSFNGTTAWMAPEVIRQQPCSEKIDVWSFGIVLWEILTCEVPYQNIDPNAVMWGVGKGSLTLPIPSSAPQGFTLLMKMCWNQRPENRPSFQQIIKHLTISEKEIAVFEQEQEYAELTRAWSTEIHEQLARLPTIDISSTLNMTNDELMKKRREELQHIADIRSHYQTKLNQVNSLYVELSSLMMQLQKREQEIRKKERLLNIQHHSSSGNSNTKKRTNNNSLSEARKKSLQIIKAVSFNPKDPIVMLSQGSLKQPHVVKSSNQLSNIQTSTGSHNNILNQSNTIQTSSPAGPAAVNNPETSSIKTLQRRKKGPGHRRNNSKGSATSWTPPSLSAIADQEEKRASISPTPNLIEKTFPKTQPIKSSPETVSMTSVKATVPSISADIDSKSNIHSRQLNPSNLKLDLENSTNSQATPTQQRPPTLFTYVTRKSSTSDPEDESQHQNLARQRRRRNLNLSNNKISSPSSITQRSIKSTTNDQCTQQIDELENNNHIIENKSDSEKINDQRKYPRSVSFQLSPSTTHDRSPSYQQRKTFHRHVPYSSSEEGEVEEIPSDHYVLDDEKHRAKHEDLNRESNGLFSSESDIYNEHNKHSSSLKNEAIFSDEGGHVSDDRPASRESLMNSDPEQEWPNHE